MLKYESTKVLTYKDTKVRRYESTNVLTYQNTKVSKYVRTYVLSYFDTLPVYIYIVRMHARMIYYIY